MPTWLIVILISVLCVGLFVAALSLTLIFKGRNIDSEISTNKDMQRLGIKCAVQEAREEMSGGECAGTGCAGTGCAGNCAGCDIEQKSGLTKKPDNRNSR